MPTDFRNLSFKDVKWELIPFEWSPIPCAFCALVLGLSTCTKDPSLTRSTKGGSVYRCFNASLTGESHG
jgi:hypothetical protein